MESGDDLLSRAVSSQVPSALRGLTSVFGMGTGGSLSPSSPENLRLRAFKTAQYLHNQSLPDQAIDLLVSASSHIAALSPPTYHLIVSEGSLALLRGILFSRWASRLDAFSVYPLRISLPSYAVGTTTVAPGMCPLRSSRTRSSSSHDSHAHDG